MRKRICFLCFVIIFCLTACSNEEIIRKSSSEKMEAYQDSIGRTTKLVGDDTASGELSISYFGYDFSGRDYIDIAVAKFKELYPNVKVNLEWESDIDNFQKYSQTLAAEVMSGTGPDVFWVMDTQDLPKMISGGVFADLYPYFNEDPYFNIEDYQYYVFRAGQPENKQFSVPLTYTVPLFLTTQEIVNQTNFNIRKCTDYFTCGEEIHKVVDQDKFEITAERPIQQFYFSYDCPYFTGIDWMNLTDMSINLDSPNLKTAFALLRDEFYQITQTTDGSYQTSYSTESAEELYSKRIYFSEFTRGSSLDYLLETCRKLTTLGAQPVVFPWRDVNGSVQAQVSERVAVRGNSPNIKNAYNFIKILIDSDMQQYEADSGRVTMCQNVPINNSALVAFVQSKTNQVQYDLVDSTELMEGISQELADQYLQFISEVRGADNFNKGFTILHDSMQPYLKGQKSYEQCIEEARLRLEIYISE